MSTFVVTSPQGARCTFHSRTYEADGGLEGYTIELEDLDFRAAAHVANPGHGFPPSILFARLADQWTGWTGTEEWRAAEGELVIVATCDRTGHVRIVFDLQNPAQSAHWTAGASVVLDAGQLERLARGARAFFDEGA